MLRRPLFRRTLVFVTLVLAVFFAGGGATAADLAVTVTALRSADGTVHVALYDSPEDFPDGDGMLEDVVVPASDPVAVFEGLPPGTYAVAVYHDENANGDFDQGIFGIPKEGYGFSNDARAFFGPPDFAEAAFDVPADGAAVTVPLTYW